MEIPIKTLAPVLIHFLNSYQLFLHEEKIKSVRLLFSMHSRLLLGLHYTQHGKAFSRMHPAHLAFASYRVGSQKTWQWLTLARYILPSVKGKFTFLLEE